jgi:adenine C2-methylase RlmN of 23S rRNA A2503 and tRNA A37
MAFKHLTQEEIQQMTFDWRYRGWTVLQLLTEEQCDEINNELERVGRMGPICVSTQIITKIGINFCTSKTHRGNGVFDGR